MSDTPIATIWVRGAPVPLGRIIGRGGEGKVYEISSMPGSVAKLHHTPPSRDLADKLSAMVAGATSGLTDIAAWPTALAYLRSNKDDAPSQGFSALFETLRGRRDHLSPIGFIMPMAARKSELFELTIPQVRMQRHAHADWQFLLAVATNLAAAVGTIHEAGHVIGDINPSNIVYGRDATVMLLDCDSFQVRSGDRTWPCNVGTPTHQPPEMQALESFTGTVRTTAHDRFGLAVCLFQILFMGRHPFSGRATDGDEMPEMDEAVRQSRYAWSADRARTRLSPPPGALGPGDFDQELAQLFEDAFAPPDAGHLRPSPEQWLSVLKRIATMQRRCTVNAAHSYPRDLPKCPWCWSEDKSSTRLFTYINPETLPKLMTVPAVAVLKGVTDRSPLADLVSAAAMPFMPGTPNTDGIIPAYRRAPATSGFTEIMSNTGVVTSCGAFWTVLIAASSPTAIGYGSALLVATGSLTFLASRLWKTKGQRAIKAERLIIKKERKAITATVASNDLRSADQRLAQIVDEHNKMTALLEKAAMLPNSADEIAGLQDRRIALALRAKSILDRLPEVAKAHADTLAAMGGRCDMALDRLETAIAAERD